jgi:antirestriction protein ArdC
LSKEEKVRSDVYQRVTDSIVAELERGVRPWLKPPCTVIT